MRGSPEPATARPGDWPAAALRPLLDHGLDVLGCLAVQRYDALVPEGFRSETLLDGARSALVIGSGGAALARRALARGGPDPVDRLTRERVAACVAALGADGHGAIALHAHERRDGRGRLAPADGRFADFAALGRESGLGVPSRLRLLVHPVYGPWLAVRSVVLTTLALSPTAPLADFAPCDGCPAPCHSACPAGALDAGLLDWPRCREERLRGGDCAAHCAARRACVWGTEYGHPAEIEAHFMASSLRLAVPRDSAPVHASPADQRRAGGETVTKR